MCYDCFCHCLYLLPNTCLTVCLFLDSVHMMESYADVLVLRHPEPLSAKVSHFLL